jgi:hypothetical protein
MTSKRLSLQQRREIFRALVEAQDRNTMTVAESLQHIQDEYAIPEDVLRQIQDEGIEKEWPPLNESPLASAAAGEVE